MSILFDHVAGTTAAFVDYTHKSIVVDQAETHCLCRSFPRHQLYSLIKRGRHRKPALVEVGYSRQWCVDYMCL